MVRTLKTNLNLKDKNSEKIYTIDELLDLHPRISKIGNFSDGVAVFKAKGDKQGVINENGKILTKDSYQVLHNFVDGLAVFRKGQKWGWLDKTGSELSFGDSSFSYTNDFYKGYAIFIDSNGKRGCIDKKGLVILNGFDFLADIEDDGFMRFEKNGLAGRVNPIVKDGFCQCEQRLSDGVNKGFISNYDTDIGITIDGYTRILDRFHNGYAFVEKNGRLCHLDTKGREFYEIEKDGEIYLEYQGKIFNRKFILSN